MLCFHVHCHVHHHCSLYCCTFTQQPVLTHSWSGLMVIRKGWNVHCKSWIHLSPMILHELEMKSVLEWNWKVKGFQRCDQLVDSFLISFKFFTIDDSMSWTRKSDWFDYDGEKWWKWMINLVMILSWLSKWKKRVKMKVDLRGKKRLTRSSIVSLLPQLIPTRVLPWNLTSPLFTIHQYIVLIFTWKHFFHFFTCSVKKLWKQQWNWISQWSG